MAIQFNNKIASGCSTRSSCLDKFGCPEGVCPDFVIRRHDTKPPLKVFVEDCDGPLDLQGLVIEVNMWALAKLKAAIDEDATYFQLADNIGFEQIMVGDIIVMDRVRMPEYMLVTGFDEINKFVRVERGYRDTTPSAWAKAQKMRIFRVMNSPAVSEMSFEDVLNVDGTTSKNVLQESFLVYEWHPEDTCLPGCYWLEFKVLKMKDAVFFLPGGIWTGEKHLYTDDFYYTGTDHTDSSVQLSYDSVNDQYLLPDNHWTGEVNLYSGNYFTGSTHDDGSVYLNRTGVPTPDTSYDEGGANLTSVTPSFTDEDLTPEDFGCILGDGVEWARRFPTTGEGFLIKIEDSPTVEQ